nr:Chain D, Peptide from Glutamine synthetase repressor [Staphylococcus aureus]7TF6_E Chain E, Peptide from Glutamine synthetase repressor [Staphylococcus aureus]7TF6_I Chain I, Peptide from Glutamine synthetase repressor [Staphylococcus aureus]7TF6_J Chain J, Peptide from Glutamine synthetase repressor [Staphylococcus aureus]7TF6_K Chain K, Peptide from Glutamine synthetase repressor [Staphylococcus aureus]7TF6_M Chain M, Peptide from Glutamine synthetase repressor [Staphylococcus aureus]7TF
PINRGDLSRFI